jgi:DNA-directed RNA polymerase beta subunit
MRQKRKKIVKMMSEQHTWNILDNHFKTKGFVHHQTESFDRFINVGIPRIITEEPDILIVAKTDKDRKFNSYRVSFSNVHIPSPTVTEETRVLRGFYPSEARQRDLTYDSPIYATVTETLEVEGEEPEVNVHMRQVLGRIPIMLRSSKCYLTHMTPQERIKAGECEYDQGGYFLVKGKERVLIAQLRGVYNINMVIAQKPGEKIKYISEMRSMSEETGHSVLIQALIGSDDHTLSFQLPYVKDPIPIGVVFKALGYRSEQFSDIIGLSCSKVDKYIRIISNDSYFVEEMVSEFYIEEELAKLKKQEIRKDEMIVLLEEKWNKMDEMEQEEWKDKARRTRALQYIGSHTVHPLKDGERRTYAEQVVEGEIFPHMGVTSTVREKVYLLGHMVHKLLATHLGLRKPDDRDNYINKRIESPGVLCHDLFRQLFKKYTGSIVAGIEKRKQTPDAMSIIPRQTDITKGFSHCFGTGNWGVPKNSYVRPGVAQILSRLSYGATLSNLRRLSIPVGKESKNAAIRQINPSQIMFVCPAECFDPETQILLWNGMSKRAGDIIVGDVLVDDLGNPTKVRTTCSGSKNMYDIVPSKNNFTKHRVTDNHILTLRIRQHKFIGNCSRKDRNYTHVVKFFNRETMKYQEKYFQSLSDSENFVDSFDDDDTLDITIKEYLKLNKTTQDHLVIFKTDGINWEKKDVDMDPYLLGMWLGDGLSNGRGFALNYKTDVETLEYWNMWAEKNGAVITKDDRHKFIICSKKNKEAGEGGLCNRVEEAPLKKYLRNYNLIGNKHIPLEYITNDRATRLKVLAGLIDTDGSVRDKGHEIRICQGPANYKIVEDAYTLSMSLGFSCSISEGKSQWTDKTSGEKKFSTYKELRITGAGIYEIPTLLPRKKLVSTENNTQLARSRSFMGSKFKLVETGDGPYVGWQLEDKRGRFSLKCGLIVHNTPEGAPVGIVLNLSLLTRISERTPTVLVKEVVEMCENIILIGDFDGPNEDTKVFLNGIILGMTGESEELLGELRDLRNVQMLPWDISISYDDIDDELHICSDEGRLLRPVFVVEDGKLVAQEEDGTNWNELVEKKAITYIDNMEANGAVIAFHQNELEKYNNNYCEIAAAMMLGVMASIIPYPDHSQSPRNCYQAAMGKQAMSMFALSHLIRADTVVHVLGAPQRPLVSTKASDMMGFNEMPSGINCVVAIACYTGSN